MQHSFTHHVFFWLKEPENQQHLDQLLTGIRTLEACPGVKQIFVGTPASTRRPVIDHTYSASLLLIFDDKAGHDAYQPSAVHEQFVSSCSSLWKQVVIYDSEG